jgi:putative flippase GtrA
MNTLLRWGKFNLVGAMGMGLQLTVLALFNRQAAGHYLYASAAAIELTLLHNFMWHLHYTWRDRRDGATRLRQFVRFHLCNGLVSMLGNLTLTRLLVHEVGLPLIISNAIAILCCSMVNFCLGNKWAFVEAPNAEASCKSEVRRPISIHSLTNSKDSESVPEIVNIGLRKAGKPRPRRKSVHEVRRGGNRPDCTGSSANY